MNTAPFRRNLIALPYVLPEIHVSFYEPQTVSLALKLAGFKPEFRGFIPGFEEIIRFKVLKNCKFRTTSITERVLPWSVLSRFIDSVRRVTALPVGWAEKSYAEN
jgi:hypothetical protein